MCNHEAEKMEIIGCLVSELQSEMRSGCGTQLFEKMRCFYTATVSFNVFVYYGVTKNYTCSCNKSSLEVGKDSWEGQRL